MLLQASRLRSSNTPTHRRELNRSLPRRSVEPKRSIAWATFCAALLLRTNRMAKEQKSLQPLTTRIRDPAAKDVNCQLERHRRVLCILLLENISPHCPRNHCPQADDREHES